MKNRTIHFIIVITVLSAISGLTLQIQSVTAENTKIEDAGFMNHWYENWDEGIEAAKSRKQTGADRLYVGPLRCLCSHGEKYLCSAGNQRTPYFRLDLYKDKHQPFGK